MNESFKRALFLMQFEPGKDIRIIKEEVDILAESKQTDMQALSMFKQSGIDEETARKALQKLASVDNTKNKSLSVPFAKAVIEMGAGRIGEILQTFSNISELVNDMRITLPMTNQQGYTVNNKVFNSYPRFSEFIQNTSHLTSGYKEWESDIKVRTDKDPIFPRPGHPEDEKTGLMVYDGNEIGRCIHYGTGGINGKYYDFCISKTPNTMWQSYRDSKTSTFYFVFDKTRSMDDPLHMTVVDHTGREGDTEWEVTDYDNRTNNIKDFGADSRGYVEYLGSRGIPIDEIFRHQPKTDEEKAEQQKLGSINRSLDWFKSLDFKEKTKYIGRGHLLSDEQFEYLWSYRKTNGGFHLLNQYLNIGHAIPETQFKLLVGDNESPEGTE